MSPKKEPSLIKRKLINLLKFSNKALMFLIRLYVKKFETRDDDLNSILSTWFQTHAENTGLVLSVQDHDIKDVYLRNAGDMTQVTIHMKPAFAGGLTRENAITTTVASLRELIANGLVQYHDILNPQFTPSAGTPAPNSENVSQELFLKVFANFLELSADLTNFNQRIFSRKDRRSITEFHLDPTAPTATIKYKIPSKKITADLLINAYLKEDMSFLRWLKIKRYNKKRELLYEHHALEVAGGFFIQNTLDSDIITTTAPEFLWHNTNDDVTQIEAVVPINTFYERVDEVLNSQRVYSLLSYNCESLCFQIMQGTACSLQIEERRRRYNPINLLKRLATIKQFHEFIKQKRSKKNKDKNSKP